MNTGVKLTTKVTFYSARADVPRQSGELDVGLGESVFYHFVEIHKLTIKFL